MPAGVEALLAFLVAGLVTLLLVPSTDPPRPSRRRDRPTRRQRSLHEAPTPKLGGLAIFVGVLISRR